MGQSTDGQICYGIMFDEDMKFPWDGDEFDGDIDNWWVFGVLGFNHSFEMFTPEGDWIGGQKWPQEKVNQYYEEKREFAESNPKLPIELVNYCSYLYPMYILAIPETCNSAARGYPDEFVPSDLTVTDEQKEKLIAFCNTYEIEFENKPAWYLSSFWG